MFCFFFYNGFIHKVIQGCSCWFGFVYWFGFFQLFAVEVNSNNCVCFQKSLYLIPAQKSGGLINESVSLYTCCIQGDL